MNQQISTFWRMSVLTVLAVAVLCLPLTPTKVIAEGEQEIKSHVFKFYLDPLLVPDMEFAKSMLPKYVTDMNYVLAKNTNRRLVFDPNTGIILTTTQPHSGSAGVLPVDGYEVWAHAVKSNLNQSYDGHMSFDVSGAAVFAGLKWFQIYDPDLLVPNTPQMRDYAIQIDHMLHEYGHVFGAAIGEYYGLSTVEDSTGVEPLLNINLGNPSDSFWQDKTDFFTDPLLRNAYGVASLGNPTSRQTYLDTVQFSVLTSKIMSGQHRWPSYRPAMPDMDNIRLIVTDNLGNPIPNAAVKIWKIRSFSPHYNELIHDTATNSEGRLTFAWNSNGDPHSNYEHLRLIKIYKDGYEAKAKYVSVYDAEIASIVHGLPELTVTAAMNTYTPPPQDTEPPQVAITSPANQSNLSGSVQIAANASDNFGVASVELRLDNNLIATLASAPYVYNWNTTAAIDGAHTITAIAYDTSNNSTQSATVSVNVDNSAPLVSSVTSSQITSSGAVITWTTNENSNSVVEYGTSTSYGSQVSNANIVTSHSMTLSGLSEYTTYNYRVRSTDSLGNSTISSNFTFTSQDVTAPAVAITNPVNGSSVRVNAITTISATATDNSAVSKVEFYVNNVLLCTDTAATYSCNWFVDKRKNINYTITVKAFDVYGNTRSHSVTVRSR